MEKILDKILNKLTMIESNTGGEIKQTKYELECDEFHEKRKTFEQTIVDKVRSIYSNGGTISFNKEEATTLYQMLCRRDRNN